MIYRVVDCNASKQFIVVIGGVNRVSQNSATIKRIVFPDVGVFLERANANIVYILLPIAML